MVSQSREHFVLQTEKNMLPYCSLPVFLTLDVSFHRDPEMYLLYGTPRLTPIDSPANRGLSADILEQARTIKEGYILTDEEDSPMRIFPGA